MVQDINKIFDAFKLVYEANDNILKGLVNRNGHRNTKEGNLQWGVLMSRNRTSKEKNGWSKRKMHTKKKKI